MAQQKTGAGAKGEVMVNGEWWMMNERKCPEGESVCVCSSHYQAATVHGPRSKRICSI
jgi:hypothetical protein